MKSICAITQITFLLLLGSATISCQKNSDTASSNSASTSLALVRDAFFQNMMAPAEAAAQIQSSGVEFRPALMNDPGKYIRYAGDDVTAATNMGVYLSDLNYCIAYKESARTKEYFTAVHELSKVIGGEKGTLEFLMKRYSDNLGQNDSVKTVVTELLARSTGNLRGTQKEKLAGIAMAAYQIENLHLALGVLETYTKDLPADDPRKATLLTLSRMVLAQRSSVESIYHFIHSYSDIQDPDQNPNYPYYGMAFEELIGIYRKLDVDGGIEKDGAEILPDTAVTELSNKVNAIRDKIVSVE